jgi:hypothetical protein
MIDLMIIFLVLAGVLLTAVAAGWLGAWWLTHTSH